MNTQEIKTFLKIREELDNLCNNIVEYIKDNYIDQLSYGLYSSYSEYYICTETQSLCIEYFDNGIDYSRTDYLPDIPIELLETESSWKQFIDNYYKRSTNKERI